MMSQRLFGLANEALAAAGSAMSGAGASIEASIEGAA